MSAALFADALQAGTHVAPPSPPPCTIDGACYPKHETWGHYGQRWRPWPGVDVRITKPEREERSVLGDQGYETPPPEEEERQAPPPLETTRPEEEENGAEPPVDTPPLNLPPIPPAPGRTPENGEAPPSLPFGQPMPPTPAPTTPPTFRPLPGTEPPPPMPETTPRPTEVPLSPPGARLLPQIPGEPAPTIQQDAPPAMPLQLTQRAITQPPTASQAHVMTLRRLPVTTVRRLPMVRQNDEPGSVVPAGAAASPGVKPRALPAVYVPSEDQPPALPAFGK
jgi:hypothetical protein